MKADNLKIVFTYSIVGFVVVAGFFTLYQTTIRADIPPTADVHGFQIIIAAFVGAAVQFITGSEIATRANSAATRAFATGATTSSPTITSSGGPPPSVTVTAPVAADVAIDGTSADGEGVP